MLSVKIGDRIGVINENIVDGVSTYSYDEFCINGIRFKGTKKLAFSMAFNPIDIFELEANKAIVVKKGINFVGKPFLTTYQIANRCKAACRYRNQRNAFRAKKNGCEENN